jgi:hypothetical protein
MGKGYELERKVREKLTASGYTADRVAGSGCWRGASTDVIALSNGHNLVIECKSLSKSSLPYNVRDDDKQLEEYKDIVGQDTDVIYVVEVTGQRLLRYAEVPADTLHEDEMDYLYKVLK